MKPGFKLPDFNYIPLILTGIGYLLIGWLLAVFQASWFVWLGTLAVTLHLANVGAEAIVLANAWVILVMFTTTAFKSWPEAWGKQFPLNNTPAWALLLIGFWLIAIALIFLLAWDYKILEQQNVKPAKILAILVTLAIYGLGWGVFIVAITY